MVYHETGAGLCHVLLQPTEKWKDSYNFRLKNENKDSYFLKLLSLLNKLFLSPTGNYFVHLGSDAANIADFLETKETKQLNEKNYGLYFHSFHGDWIRNTCLFAHLEQ